MLLSRERRAPRRSCRFRSTSIWRSAPRLRNESRRQRRRSLASAETRAALFERGHDRGLVRGGVVSDLSWLRRRRRSAITPRISRDSPPTLIASLGRRCSVVRATGGSFRNERHRQASSTENQIRQGGRAARVTTAAQARARDEWRQRYIRAMAAGLFPNAREQR